MGPPGKPYLYFRCNHLGIALSIYPIPCHRSLCVDHQSSSLDSEHWVEHWCAHTMRASMLGPLKPARRGVYDEKKCGSSTHLENVNVRWSDMDECPICLEERSGKIPVRVLDCGHVFPTCCIKTWLEQYQHICPLCMAATSPERAPSQLQQLLAHIRSPFRIKKPVT
jgi:hypothetical protein